MTHYECIINEFDEYYSNFDNAEKVLYEGLDKLIKEHKNESFEDDKSQYDRNRGRFGA